MTAAERAMVNQVQVILFVALVLAITIGVSAAREASCSKPPAVSPGSPGSAELPRVEVLAHRRAAHAHDNGR